MRLPKQIGDNAMKEKIRLFQKFGVYLAAMGVAFVDWGDYLASTDKDADAKMGFYVFIKTDQGGEVCIGEYVRQKAPKKSWVFKPDKTLNFGLPIRRF